MTLHTGLVGWPCIDLVLLHLPVGSWHCWLPPRWISSHTFSYFSLFSIPPVQTCKYACFHKSNSEPFEKHFISISMSLHAWPQPQHTRAPLSPSFLALHLMLFWIPCWHESVANEAMQWNICYWGHPDLLSWSEWSHHKKANVHQRDLSENQMDDRIV